MDADWDAVDVSNQERLAEIFDEHGWPGWSLVGQDGSTAAWAIVQHADLDLDFQRRGLELLEAAVDAGDASPGDLAYLTDRVLVAEGKPQVYGTQWGLSVIGEPEPRTPIEDEANVDDRRAAAGLSTLDEYVEELQSAPGQRSTPPAQVQFQVNQRAWSRSPRGGVKPLAVPTVGGASGP